MIRTSPLVFRIIWTICLLLGLLLLAPVVVISFLLVVGSSIAFIGSGTIIGLVLSTVLGLVLSMISLRRLSQSR